MTKIADNRFKDNDNNMVEIIKELSSKGLGYFKAVPELIKAGYVDEEGKCTISQRQYFYNRKPSSRKMKITLDADMADWADSHPEEIFAYIKARMAQDK